MKNIAPQNIPYTSKSTPEAIIDVTDRLRQPRPALFKPRHARTNATTAHQKLNFSELIITHHAATDATAPATDINVQTNEDAFCSFAGCS